MAKFRRAFDLQLPPKLIAHMQDELAEDVLFEFALGFGCVFERVGTTDTNLERAGLDEIAQFVPALRMGDAIESVRGHTLARFGFGLYAVRKSDVSTIAHGFENGLRGVAARQDERGIETIGGKCFGFVHHIAAVPVHRSIGAQLLHKIDAIGARSDRKHANAHRLSELKHDVADAAARPPDEQGLTRRELQFFHAAQARDGVHRHRARFLHRELFRGHCCVISGNDDVLRIEAAFGILKADAVHAVSFGKARHATSYGDDDARAIAAQDARKVVAAPDHFAFALHHVPDTDSGDAHANEHLVITDGWHGNGVRRKNFGATVLVDGHRFHLLWNSCHDTYPTCRKKRFKARAIGFKSLTISRLVRASDARFTVPMTSRLSTFAFATVALLIMGVARGPQAAQAQDTTPLIQPDPLNAQGLSDALGGPTLLTLHLNDVAPKSVFAKIAKQIDQPIIVDDSKEQIWKERRVTIDVDQQPFWRVMAQLSRSVGFTWSRRVGQQGFVVSPSAAVLRELTSPGVDIGPLRVVALQALRQQWAGASFADPTEQIRENGDALRLKLSVLPDPKITVVTDTARFETLDTSGEGSFPFRRSQSSANAPRAFGAFGPAIWSLQSDLKLSPSQSTQSLDFSGQMRFTAITRKDEWRIDNPLTAKEVSRDFPTNKGTVRVTFRGRSARERDVEPPQFKYTFELTTQLVDGTDSPAERQVMANFDAVVAQESRVTDRKGIALAFSSSMRGGGQNNVSQSFARTRSINGRDTSGEPDVYTIIVPLETHEVVLPFELRDLTLPPSPGEQRAR